MITLPVWMVVVGCILIVALSFATEMFNYLGWKRGFRAGCNIYKDDRKEGYAAGLRDGECLERTRQNVAYCENIYKELARFRKGA